MRLDQRIFAPLAASVFALASCSGGGGGGGGVVETLSSDESRAYFHDPNEGGRTTRLQLVEVNWGRLVDVHDVDAAGTPSAEPVFRDFVVGENVQTDGIDYVLDVSPITQHTRLIVLRQRGAATPGRASFEDLVRRAASALPGVLARHDDGTSPGPFSYVPRNGCLMLRFSDCLDDSQRMADQLDSLVHVYTGYRPNAPFVARVMFDPNHGAEIGGAFHSTRVLIDLTVSELEAAKLARFVAVNLEGLPASEEARGDPNVSIRIPTRADPNRGQLQILRALSGAALSSEQNGPVDLTSTTREVVRACRSGHTADGNNGFLHDRTPPRVLGEWPVVLSDVRADLASGDAARYRVDVSFPTVCQHALGRGDVVTVGGHFLEVVEATTPPRQDELGGVALRFVGGGAPPSPRDLFGQASLLTAYNPLSEAEFGCWVQFAPPAEIFPATNVAPNSRVTVRFSESISPTSLEPMDGFLLLRGDSGLATTNAEDVVVGHVTWQADLRAFSFHPLLPFAHRAGALEPLHIRLSGVQDLSGADLAHELPPIDFTLAPDAAEQRNGSLTLSFSDVDEVEPRDGALGSLDDLRGQVVYDFDRGRIRPRPVLHSSYVADVTNPVPSSMSIFTRGPVWTPLSPLGSRCQSVWRYADFGWNATDETKYNLDIVGLHWAPFGGIASRDYFPQFEILLSHAAFLPDDDLNKNRLPAHPRSGLHTSSFAENILDDPASPQTVVHPWSLGFEIDPADVFVSASGRKLMPYPMNRGTGALRTYTWRDTAAQAVGGEGGVGIPMDIEGGPPHGIVPQTKVGSLYGPTDIPTLGLPLLTEIRCFPSFALGTNGFQVALATNSSAQPNFRVWSTGGYDTEGREQFVDPDIENVPRGGYNPSSRPPGERTTHRGDNTFYIGQIDTVVRVSRAHTAWMDTGFDGATFREPMLVPPPEEQPPGTRVVIDYRGASSFASAAGSLPFDAAQLDAYGTVMDRTVGPMRPIAVNYHPGGKGWASSISAIDGARYFQLRLTFVNDLSSQRTAELSAVGVAFEER